MWVSWMSHARENNRGKPFPVSASSCFPAIVCVSGSLLHSYTNEVQFNRTFEVYFLLTGVCSRWFAFEISHDGCFSRYTHNIERRKLTEHEHPSEESSLGAFVRPVLPTEKLILACLHLDLVEPTKVTSVFYWLQLQFRTRCVCQYARDYDRILPVGKHSWKKLGNIVTSALVRFSVVSSH